VKPGKLFSAEHSVARMMEVVEQLAMQDSGRFLDYSGAPIEW